MSSFTSAIDAVRQHDPAMGGAGLHRNLRDSDVLAHSLEGAVEAGHEGVELRHGRILEADLADFSSHRDRHPFRLTVPDEPGDLRGTLVVGALLLVECREGKIDQRRGIDVDVEEAGGDLLGDQLLDLAHFGLGIGLVLLGVDLAVIALNEEREVIPLAQRSTDHHRHILGRTLVGVGDLGACDLEEDRRAIAFQCGTEDGPGGVVGQHADVDGWHRESGTLSAPASHVEFVNRGRTHSEGGPELPEQ